MKPDNKSYFAVASAFPAIEAHVRLSCVQYTSLCKAREFLIDCLMIQESYGYVVEDYLELERVIEGHVRQSSESSAGSWCDAMDRLHDVSRRLTHLLGTSAAYLDVTKKRLCRMFRGTDAVLARFLDLRNSHLSSVGDSALWRALRGHSLHRGSPVSKVVLRGRIISECGEQPMRVEHTMALGIDRSALDDRSIKKEMREALELFVDDADARMMAQRECRSLEAIHQDLLQMLEPFHARSTDDLAKAIERFEKIAASTDAYPALARYDDAGQRIEELHLSLQWTERYRTLRLKYGAIPSLPAAIVVTKADASPTQLLEEPNGAGQSPN